MTLVHKEYQQGLLYLVPMAAQAFDVHSTDCIGT